MYQVVSWNVRIIIDNVYPLRHLKKHIHPRSKVNVTNITWLYKHNIIVYAILCLLETWVMERETYINSWHTVVHIHVKYRWDKTNIDENSPSIRITFLTTTTATINTTLHTKPTPQTILAQFPKSRPKWRSGEKHDGNNECPVEDEDGGDYHEPWIF